MTLLTTLVAILPLALSVVAQGGQVWLVILILESGPADDEDTATLVKVAVHLHPVCAYDAYVVAYADKKPGCSEYGFCGSDNVRARPFPVVDHSDTIFHHSSASEDAIPSVCRLLCSDLRVLIPIFRVKQA